MEIKTQKVKKVAEAAKAAAQAIENTPVSQLSKEGVQTSEKKTGGIFGKILGGIGKVASVVGPAVNAVVPGVGSAISIAGKLAQTLNDDQWFEGFQGAGATFNEPIAIVKKGMDGVQKKFDIRSAIAVVPSTPLWIKSKLDNDDSDREDDLHAEILPTLLSAIRTKTNNVIVDETENYYKAFVLSSHLYAMYYTGMKYIKLTEKLPTNIPNVTQLFTCVYPSHFSAFKGVIDSLGDYLKTNASLPHAWTSYLRWRFGTAFLSDNTDKPGLICYDMQHIFGNVRPPFIKDACDIRMLSTKYTASQLWSNYKVGTMAMLQRVYDYAKLVVNSGYKIEDVSYFFNCPSFISGRRIARPCYDYVGDTGTASRFFADMAAIVALGDPSTITTSVLLGTWLTGYTALNIGISMNDVNRNAIEHGDFAYPEQWAQAIEWYKAKLAACGKALADINVTFKDHVQDFTVDERHYDTKEHVLRANMFPTEINPNGGNANIAVLSGFDGDINLGNNLAEVDDLYSVIMDTHLNMNAALQATTISTGYRNPIDGSRNAIVNVLDPEIFIYNQAEISVQVPGRSFVLAQKWHNTMISMTAATRYYGSLSTIAGETYIARGTGDYAVVNAPLVSLAGGNFPTVPFRSVKLAGYEPDIASLGALTDQQAAEAYMVFMDVIVANKASINLGFENTGNCDVTVGTTDFYTFNATLADYDTCYLTGTQLKAIQRLCIRNLIRADYKRTDHREEVKDGLAETVKLANEGLEKVV